MQVSNVIQFEKRSHDNPTVDFKQQLEKGAQEISLSGPEIGNKEVAEIAHLIKQNRNLTSLDISHNPLGDEGGKMLLEALKTNFTLLTLRMDNTQIKDKG